MNFRFFGLLEYLVCLTGRCGTTDSFIEVKVICIIYDSRVSFMLIKPQIKNIRKKDQVKYSFQ